MTVNLPNDDYVVLDTSMALTIEQTTTEDQLVQAEAEDLRIEHIFSRKVEDIYSELAVVSSSRDWDVLVSYVDADYLLSLELPYPYIQRLCGLLVSYCRSLKKTCPSVWRDFAGGQFPYEEDIRRMRMAMSG